MTGGQRLYRRRGWVGYKGSREAADGFINRMSSLVVEGDRFDHAVGSGRYIERRAGKRIELRVRL